MNKNVERLQKDVEALMKRLNDHSNEIYVLVNDEDYDSDKFIEIKDLLNSDLRILFGLKDELIDVIKKIDTDAKKLTEILKPARNTLHSRLNWTDKIRHYFHQQKM